MFLPPQLFIPMRVKSLMRNRPFAHPAVALATFLALVATVSAVAQAPISNGYPAGYSPALPRAAYQDSQPISAILDWTPPAMTDLRSEASSKTSFAFDRSMLDLIGGLDNGNDPEFRRAFAKLDGVSVQVLRFGPAGIPSEQAVGAVREAYHVRGLKHLVTSVGSGGPIHSRTTDVWVVLDGSNVKGAVILGETARSVTLVTVKGDLSPADLLHLHGHLGIPKLDNDDTGSDRPRTYAPRSYQPGSDGTWTPQNN